MKFKTCVKSEHSFFSYVHFSATNIRMVMTMTTTSTATPTTVMTTKTLCYAINDYDQGTDDDDDGIERLANVELKVAQLFV